MANNKNNSKDTPKDSKTTHSNVPAKNTNPKLNETIEKIRGEVPGIGDTIVFKGNGIDLPKKD